MANTVLENAELVTKVTLAGTVTKGQPIAYDGSSGYVAADASDAATNLYAKYIAMEAGVSGGVIGACKRCILQDDDAPYTANSVYYVSETAGAVTTTRPTTDGALIQVIGQAVDTGRLQVHIKDPQEVEVWLPCPSYNAMGAGVPEGHVADGTTTPWVGADADAATVVATFVGRFPSGLIGNPAEVSVLCNTQAATTIDMDVTLVAAYDDTTNTGYDSGGTITAQTMAVGDNGVHKLDITSAFDADFCKPGAAFGVQLDPDAGDFIVLGMYFRYLCV